MTGGWISRLEPAVGEAQPFSLADDGGQIAVRIGEAILRLEPHMGPEGTGWCRFEGMSYQFSVAVSGSRVHLWLDGEAYVFELSGGPPPRGAAGTAAAGDPTATVPGKVLNVLVREGDFVEAGQRLAVIESMKMEFAVQAPRSGRVKRVLVGTGDQVIAGQRLVELDAAGEGQN